MTAQETRKAMLTIILGVILLGTGPIFVKSVQANGVLVGFYRLFFAGLMLSAPAWLLKPKAEPLLPSKRGLILALLGGLVFALNISLWCTALNYTTASTVTLLDNTAPVWVGLIGWLVLKEKQSWQYWLGLLVTIGGAGVMIGWDFLRGGSAQTTGNLLSLASGVSYALYILVTQQARRHMNSLRYSWMVAVSGALVLFLTALLLGLFTPPLPLRSLVLIFLMALTSQVIAWLLVNHALGKLPAAGASVALVGQPLVATVLGILLLGEVPSWLQLAGALICLAGILIVQRNLPQKAAPAGIE